MLPNKSSKELSPVQKDLNLRIFDLAIGRVLKKAYVSFDTKTKEEMDVVFASGDDKNKEQFIKKNIPNFRKFFGQEVKEIEEKIKAEIERRV